MENDLENGADAPASSTLASSSAPPAPAAPSASDLQTQVDGDDASDAPESAGGDAPPAAPAASNVAPSSGAPADPVNQLGTVADPPPAPPPAPASSSVEPEPPPAPAAPSAPRDEDTSLVGEVLTCACFEGGLPIEGLVIDQRYGDALLELSNGETWPVRGSRIEGRTWRHDATDYPPPGADPSFDEQYRTKPRAQAVANLVLCRVLANVVAKGVDAFGVERHNWEPKQVAQFVSTDVESLPHVFERLS